MSYPQVVTELSSACTTRTRYAIHELSLFILSSNTIDGQHDCRFVTHLAYLEIFMNKRTFVKH